MTNPKRGEIKITLGDQTYDGRVTLDVVMRIERQMGKGIVKIAQSLSEADISTFEVVGILTPVIKAGGNNVDEKAIGKAVGEAGLANGIAQCGEILALALGAGGDEGNEDEAEALL